MGKKNMEDDLPTGTGLTLPVGGSATANIQFDGDIDAFSVTLEAGETYQFDVTGTSSPALFDPVLSLGDGTGARIAQNDDFGGSRDPRIEFTPSISGEYFLYVEGFGTSTGNFQISATQTSQPPITTFDDYPTGTSGFLSVGSFTTGNIETAADIDSFNVFLQEGYTYRLTARGSDTDDGTLADPVIDLYDPSGTYLQSDNDTGFGRNAEFSSFVAASTGTYRMDIYSADFTSAGTYFVTASEIAGPPITTFDDYPTGTSGSLSVGSSTFGNIETLGDTDAFTVLLEDGVTYRFDLSENSSQGGLTLNPFLQLTTSTGTVLTFDNDSGPSTDARIEFTPTFFGAYVLSAEGVGASTGLYEISATEVTTTSFDDYPSGTSGTVTVGGSTTGNIETSGDTDAFNVYLLGGYTYQFDLMGTSASGGFALSNPLLQLTDTSGSVFILNDNGGSGLNSRITDFTPQSSSFYSLTAQGAQGTTGVYEISATQTALPPTTPGPTTPGPTTPGPTTPGPTTPGPTEPTAPEYVQTIILLYEAALNRNGNYDWDGVNFWIDRYESGTSYQTIARSFLNSPEFERNFGEPLVPTQGNFLNNDQFVNTMYQNVLDRGGDPSGLQYWNSVLQGNGNRESVLLNFARSPENFSNNDDSLVAIYDAGDGYWLI